MLILQRKVGTGVGWELSGGVSLDGEFGTIGLGDHTVYDFEFKSDGTVAYTCGVNYQIRQLDLTTPWDVTSGVSHSTSSAVLTQFDGFTFKPDGTKLYVERAFTKVIYQYDLSTPWDLSTITDDSKSLDVSSEEAFTVNDFFIKPDGTKVYVIGNTDFVYQYTLSTPWDLSTGSYDSKSFDTTFAGPVSVDFNPTGTKMFVISDTSSGAIYQYTLSTPWDVSTASVDVGAPQVTLPNGGVHQHYNITFTPNGQKLFAAYNNTSNDSLDAIRQYTIL